MDLKEIHKKCSETFEQTLLEEDGWRSNACKIWDVLTENKNGCDNCIGENFNQMIQSLISEWFTAYEPTNGHHPEFYTKTYILWLYLFYERIEFLINQIDPNKNFHLVQEYRRSLNTMNTIRLWANFIKHPKQFVYVHWPTYIFEGERFDRNEDTILVNTSFLKDHYSSETDDQPISLQNKDTVVVQFPKLDILTKGFCDELNSFFKFICNNEMIASHLRKISNRDVPEWGE